MKVQLRINVSGVGKDGDTVDVKSDQANWLVDGGYATKVGAPAAPKAAAKKAAAPKAESVADKTDSPAPAGGA